MTNFIATAFKDGRFICSSNHQIETSYDDLIAGDIHDKLNQSEAVMLQFPKDITIKLTNSGNEVQARVIDCSSGEPVITVAHGKLGKSNGITNTPLAWTESGELFIVKLITNYMNRY